MRGLIVQSSNAFHRRAAREGWPGFFQLEISALSCFIIVTLVSLAGNFYGRSEKAQGEKSKIGIAYKGFDYLFSYED